MQGVLAEDTDSDKIEMTIKEIGRKIYEKLSYERRESWGFGAFSCWNPEEEERREEGGKAFRLGRALKSKVGIFPRFTLSLHIAWNALEEAKKT